MSQSSIEAMVANSEILNEENPIYSVRKMSLVDSYKTLKGKFRAAFYRYDNGKWVLTDEDKKEVERHTLETVAKRYHTTPEHVIETIKKLNI